MDGLKTVEHYNQKIKSDKYQQPDVKFFASRCVGLEDYAIDLFLRYAAVFLGYQYAEQQPMKEIACGMSYIASDATEVKI